MDTVVYFIENLTLWVWARSIWPRLVWGRLRRGPRVTHCYVMDGSYLALLLAKASAGTAGVSVQRLHFRTEDMRDQEGRLSRLRVAHWDLNEAQRRATAEPIFRQALESEPLARRLPLFLAKNVATMGSYDGDTMERALLKVQVCLWKVRQEAGQHVAPVLFLERRPWLNVIVSYAGQKGVTIIPVRLSFKLSAFLRRRLPPQLIDFLRVLRYRPGWRNLTSIFKGSTGSRPAAGAGKEVKRSVDGSGGSVADSGPRVAVEYYGQLNLNRPELHSDLFFWQRSSLPGGNLLLIFFMPQDPLDEAKWSQLREHGMSAVALHPAAATVPGVPMFTRRPVRSREPRAGPVTGDGLNAAWLREQVASYHSLRSYWTRVFEESRTKVYVTWLPGDASHGVKADAIQALGGVTAIYQRSYESHPVEYNSNIAADILFGFSPKLAEVYRRPDSVVRYHVATGYLGDHRFPLLRGGARMVRDGLERHGAQRILAYFDENSVDDGRWVGGHAFMRDSYTFLLEKVLAEPWLGVVLKPKVPVSLRRRLGPVAKLLERALATGRCYIYESGAIQSSQSSHTPAAAALAADVAVHGVLRTATAGMEAALAGVPTLLLDQEGWSVSPLYRLGEGRVVFTHWEGLWEACQRHWSAPGGVPGLGDWSPMLDELDPFRDGRAAERMGTYIQWLIEGFQAGLDRERVMAEAADRYSAKWGQDKVTRLDCGTHELDPGLRRYVAADG